MVDGTDCPMTPDEQQCTGTSVPPDGVVVSAAYDLCEPLLPSSLDAFHPHGGGPVDAAPVETEEDVPV